jgi:hypothetical protein
VKKEGNVTEPKKIIVRAKPKGTLDSVEGNPKIPDVSNDLPTTPAKFSKPATVIDTSGKVGPGGDDAAKPVKLPKIGDEVTVVKLTNLYDKYAPDVLRSLLESAPKKRGAPRRWTVRGDLPQPAQYQAMKQTQYTRTVESLVDDAFNTFDDLASEVRDWHRNLPEGLQQADRGEWLDEAANTLEGLQRLDVPEAISNVTVVYYPGLGIASRADRVGEAVAMLQTARDAIDTDGDEARVDCEDCEGKGKKDCDHCGTTDAVDCDECGGTGKVEVEGLDDFVSELESAIGEAEGVEIPGMYG